MKKRSYFLWIGLFSLLFVLLFAVSCPEPKVNPDQQVRPKITGDGPILVFTKNAIQFQCGDMITKEVIVEKLKNPNFLTITPNNEAHEGEFSIEVADFTIPAHTHGFFEISFSVADSTGKKTECTFAIKINENKAPGSVTLNYDGSTALKFPVGTDPVLNITALLRKEGSGLSVMNTNSCADAKGYTMVDGVFPPDPALGMSYYAVIGVYPDVKFKVQDYLGVKSQEVTVSIEIISPDQPPMIVPPHEALEKEYLATVTDEMLFAHLKTGSIFSPDVSVNWENSTFHRITTVDSSKTGIQKIYFRVKDKHQNQSEISFIRVNFVAGNLERNLLKDGGFEEDSAPLVGVPTKDIYRDARISGNWELVPTTISLRDNHAEYGSVPNRMLNDCSTSCSGNPADYKQGPIIFDVTRFAGPPNNCVDNGDEGYTKVATKKHMEDLAALGNLEHMLVYRAKEKKNSGDYSLALRGKYYCPMKAMSGASLWYYWYFWGVGCAVQQVVTLEKGVNYTAGVKIIRSFGRDGENELNGMVGSIYLTIKTQTSSPEIIKQIHIKGHPVASLYGKFVSFQSDTFSVAENTDVIFEIRRYLSNDDGDQDETNSTWGYSPIYIDDCSLLYQLPAPPAHLPEEEQNPPSEG